MEQRENKRRENRRRVGALAENRARAYLEAGGMEILEQNFRCRGGEIDLIGKDGDCLVFLEIKYRKNGAAGHPAEAVGYAKQRRISHAADYYRYVRQIPPDMPQRYDVVAILGEEISWYQNAFPHRP